MIADLKPYPRYRQAEGGWLGEIPAHWEIRRMKYVVREIDSRSTTGKEQLLRVSQYTGVTERDRADGLDEPDTRAESLLGYKCVNPSDLVINIMLAWNGSMGVSRYSGIVSPAYCVYRFERDLHPWYFHELLRSPVYKARIKESSTGVVDSRLRLYSDDLGRIEAILPSPEEQKAIVHFLDWANGRLERAIRAKRKVIALLNEQKQAIIHRAVTCGLDPSAPRKSSGVPWLGDVPDNWEVTVAKRVCSVFIPQRDKPELNEVEGTPWITMEHIGKTFLKPSRFYVRDRDAKAAGSRTAPQGSVLASCVGRFGIASINTEPVIINQQIQAFIPKQRISKFFLLYSVLIAKPYFEMRGNSTTLAYVDREGFETMPLLIPPLSEQEAIVSYLEKATAKFDLSISRLEREIELLREYRTRLVADVVTGKLDVREAATHLPDAAEPEIHEADEAELDPEEADQEVIA